MTGIVSGLTTSFKTDQLGATPHLFPTHTFKLALYDSTASLGPDTAVYTSAGEVSGTGYTAGGAIITWAGATSSGTTAWLDATDIEWANSTITTRAGLIYNTSLSNKSVAVLDFGSNRISSASTLTVVFPLPNSTDAIIRL